ncbi:MAG: DUF2306 domain-containing protein [Burkholderiales bacterium]
MNVNLQDVGAGTAPVGFTPLRPATRLDSVANAALTAAARFWFVVAVVGQWLFACYVTAVYGGAALRGDWEAWNKILPRGLMAGDPFGNVTLAVHLLLAAVITVGGPLQLVPHIRTYAPSFHRWNGRLYVLTAFTMSASGLYMLLTRGTVGDVSQHTAIGLNAALIMLCAALAWRNALAREFAAHRRWALRLFLAVSGVWFFRVGLMLWLVVNRRPAGFDPATFQGPFLTFLAFAQFLLPLAVLELYLRARDRAGVQGRIAMAAALSVLTVAMAVGIVGAVMGMWLPRLR